MGIESRTETEIRRHHPHLADGAFGEPAAHLDDSWDEAGPHRFHEEQLPRPRLSDDGLCFRRVEGEGLLT